ncbi:prepilin-type N-terminal cleavage/methylation domain-containing protein [Pseudoalteromonas sp. NEC-BIFX-2020_002]|uniref:prepilin-type N-terminal cleavage/methylation domain-containing protein n=1 Tax=Pseudoalteromonas sp. NEC-BIFX-2020_002 TaxID=2732353 RepID=UPI00147712B6|nr:prepilin-type N-terminal cleavage/methylation domain-containing protein [Pseudoalteromonas sp. NEC-BIFX-2020_002]NNG43557.1 prepilin-type N-terminal cleavage/methylation domain-containing protein [Pseudoalteromonas sp. NEC-BIFX-2020_002]
MRALNTGFTLIELIISIVIFAIALTIITGLIAPQARQSADPILQLRANELGQSLMNEIQSKAFDEHSERAPPFRRCSESGFAAPNCTVVADLGADSGETRTTYDDVDDYLALNAQPITNSLGEQLTQYQDFSVAVTVVYDSDRNSTTVNDGTTLKLITLIVSAPNGEQYGFSAYKGNY